MHPEQKFRMNEDEPLRTLAARSPFAAIFLNADGHPHVIQAPVVVQEDELWFHVSRRNAAFPHLDGARALILFSGMDFYVSPDWYGAPDQVPTWNYESVEVAGILRPLDQNELVRQLDIASAQEETRLLPKPAWTREKMDQRRFTAMVQAIAGFRLQVETVRTTSKFSQNKSAAMRDGVIAALEGRGRDDHAAKMRRP